MVYEESLIVPHRSAKFQTFPITNSRLSANLVLNCIDFLRFKIFCFKFFLEKIRRAEKSLLGQFCAVLDSLQRHIFFLRIFCTFNFRIKFQSSHLTKKETEGASKHLLCY